MITRGISSSYFPIFHPHAGKESVGCKSFNNIEKNNSLSILSFLPTPTHACPPACMCARVRQGERMNESVRFNNSMLQRVLRCFIRFTIAFLSHFAVPPWPKSRRDARGNSRLVHHSLFSLSGFSASGYATGAHRRNWLVEVEESVVSAERTRLGATWRERGATFGNFRRRIEL
jgi:hypothetical protein